MDTRNKRLYIYAYAAAFLLAAVLIFVFVPMQASAAPLPEFEEAVITGDSVNMRLRPSAESPAVYKFEQNTRVGVFCEEDNGWYRIIFGNYRGYVSGEYVYMSSADEMYGNIRTDNTSIYSGTGAYGAPLATLNAGQGIEIVGASGEFYEVTTDNNITGFIPIANIELTKAKVAATMLKEGMEGTEVKKMQQQLKERGFLLTSATGYYGEKTQDAVKLFQRKAGLSADGIAGEKTLEMLNDESNGIKVTLAERAGISGDVEYSTWDKIKNVFSKGTYATVVDVRTGITYKAYRFGGWYHADCVPASKADAAKIKKMSGGKWSWNRRAVWVVVGGHVYAASQHTMPHMVDYDRNDDFPGHFCIHFKDSKVHETSKPCPRHQACVVAAYNAAH